MTPGTQVKIVSQDRLLSKYAGRTLTIVYNGPFSGHYVVNDAKTGASFIVSQYAIAPV